MTAKQIENIAKLAAAGLEAVYAAGKINSPEDAERWYWVCVGEAIAFLSEKTA